MKPILLSITLFLAIFFSIAYLSRYIYALKNNQSAYNPITITILIAMFWATSIYLILTTYITIKQ